MFTLHISGIAWLKVSAWYRWSGSALRHRDHRYPRRYGAGCDCHMQTAAVWSVVRRWVCRGEAGSPPTGAGRTARWSVHRWCCHCWVACCASWLPVFPVSKAWGVLADQDWRWEFDAVAYLGFHKGGGGKFLLAIKAHTTLFFNFFLWWEKKNFCQKEAWPNAPSKYATDSTPRQLWKSIVALMGPRVRFGTFNHRSDGLPSILRCQGGWGACIHRRCPPPPSRRSRRSTPDAVSLNLRC